MDNIPHRTKAVPAGWAEVLAESEAEAEAGLFVPAEVVRQELLDSIARMEAKAAGRKGKPATRR
jgi:predicted transcriptional regulator